MEIREASENDNQGLIELTRLTPMKGVISLRIDRQPDFFRLIRRRGEGVLMVAVEKNKIIGCFSATKRSVIVKGNTETVYYLADFKVHPEYRGTTASIRLVKAIVDYLLKNAAELVFSTASEGNVRVLPFFKGRAGIHEWYRAGKFDVCSILPSHELPTDPCTILKGAPPGFSLPDYYQSYYKMHYSVAPVIREQDMAGTINLVAVVNGEVVGAINLADISSMKQTIVTGIPFWLQLATRFSKRFSDMFGWPVIPGIGEQVRMLNLRYWAFNTGHEAAFRALIQSARNIAATEKYHFLSVGVHQRDPLQKIFKSFRHLRFTANGFIIIKDEAKIKTYTEGILFEDFTIN